MKFKVTVFRIILVFLAVLVFYSCGTGMKIKKDNFKQINSAFSGTYNLFYYNSTSKNSSYEPDLLALFNIESNTKTKNVTIKFDNENDLIISYESFLGVETEIFQGKFKKRGYYEVFLNKKKVQIPPLFPIIYSSVNIDRVRIALNKEGDLIIDKYWERGGNIFILAAGSQNRTQYYFKKRNNIIKEK